MSAEDFTGLVMVSNEAYWIHLVLHAPMTILPRVIVAVNNSNDDTLEIARILAKTNPSLDVWDCGELTPEEVGELRTKMMAAVETPFAFQVDGDEVYAPSIFKEIVDRGMPTGKYTGFTTIYEIGEDAQGLFVAKPFSALRILAKWVTFYGSYPWEYPVVYGQDETYYYFPSHLIGWHTHGLRRSPSDDTTYLRNNKKHQLEVIRRITELPFVAEMGTGSFPNPYFKE